MTSRPELPDPHLERRPSAAERTRARRATRATSTLEQVLRALGTILVAALVMATLFTWWTPSSFLPADSAGVLAVALATQSSAAQAAPLVATESPENRVGIVAGHRGIHPRTGLRDPGAICTDGLTEVSVNERVATLVMERLRAEGYRVDLMDEFDPRLSGYQAAALVSIHSDSCEYVNDQATGYKVAAVSESQIPERNARLVGCMVARYAEETGLNFHPSVTFDMTQYHNFYEIAPDTPGAIIEIGFLNLDRSLLTEHPERVAAGVTEGILCFLRNEPIEGEVVGQEGP